MLDARKKVHRIPEVVSLVFIARYVSDHGYDGYKALCQRKLLQSARVESNLARNYPPCLLEWRSNRKRVNMALTTECADGM
ncbi:hypothetical protein PR048_003005 [Dryococelus australis]|uniref:Uncharacterized protein n=1 Tax=Dryococelus australis TaxID=614101 RepID=A0ABQ9ILW5_9NEOP|nr:hypothetical protein PR048_003005 [Dryococelus australis]